MKAIESKMLDVPCAGSLTTEVDVGKCYATVTNIPLPESGKTNISYDLTGATTSITNGNMEDASGNEFNIGITRVTYNYVGGSCYFTIIVLPPIILTGAVEERNNTPGECFYTVAGTEFDPQINLQGSGPQCAEMSSFSYKNDFNGLSTLAGEDLPVGNHAITWTFYFNNTQVDTKVITVNVVDNETFAVTAPSDDIVTIAGCSTNRSYTFTVKDNCPITSVLKYTLSGATQKTEATASSLTISEVFSVGKTDVNYVISNNAEQQTGAFSVTVLPEFTLPTGPINKATPADQCSYTVTGTELDPVLSCNSTIEGFSVTNDFNNSVTLDGAMMPVGTHTITWTSEYDNQVVQTEQVTVIVEDKTAPVIANCPTPFTTYTDQCFATLDIPLDVTDNCSVTIAYTLTGATVANGTGEIAGIPFNIGTTTVTYTVTDGTNTTQCTFPVTVLPNFTLPSSATISNTPGECGYVVSGNEFDPTFGCTGLPVSYAYSCELNGSPVNTLDQVLLPVDDNGNVIKWIFKLNGVVVQEKSFTITVIDDEAPDITCPTVVYPSGTSYFPTNSATQCTHTGSFSAPAVTDNCTPANQLVITYEITNGTTTIPGNGAIVDVPFPVGTNTVTYTVADLSGNRSNCSFTVEVRDGTPPVITTCPTAGYPQGKTYFPTDLDQCTSKQSYKAPEATDNCTPAKQLMKTYKITTVNGTVTGTDNIVNFEFPVGINTVTFTITDASGNAATCTFTVEVKDEQLPVAICQDITVTLGILSGEATITAANINNGSKDNCGPVTMTLRKYKFDCRDVGNVPVTLIVTDASGNQDSCISTVLVRYDGSVAPQVAFRKSEICSNTNAELDLTNARFGPVTDWSWTVTVPAGITPVPAIGLNGAAKGDTTIIRQFDNATDAVANVTYTVTSMLYGKCSLGPVSWEVSVNPRPKLVAITDTICNNTSSDKIVRTTSHVSASANVYYSWTVSNNPDVDGEMDSSTEQIIGTTINQELDNRTPVSQKVTYTLSPSLHLLNDVCKYTGYDKQVELTIEPTPIIKVSVGQDTVCNNTTVIFRIDSLNKPAGRWQYTLSATMPNNGNATPDVNNRIGRQNESFSQTLYHEATGWRSMRYDFSPQIVTLQGRTCHAPIQNDTLVVVRVNPTPLMGIVNFQDSICFKDDGPEIRITSNNGRVLGDLKYNLWKVDYAGSTIVENVATPGAVDFAGRTAAIDQTALWNKSNTEQTVAYYIYPFIEYRNSLHCSGDSVEQKIYLASEVLFDMKADTVNGGVHNISCFGASDGVIKVLNQNGGWSAKGYDYQWSGFVNSVNAPIVTNRTASTYGVTVIDKVIGCQAHRNITLTQPEKLILLEPIPGVDFKSPDCNGPTGYLKVHVLGGTRPNWHPYEFKSILDDDSSVFSYTGEDSVYINLKSGTYKVSVVDANQCIATRYYELPYYSGATILYPSWNRLPYGPDEDGREYDISCHGANDGSMNPYPDPTVRLFSKYTWKYNDVVFKSDTVGPGDPYYKYDPNGGDFRLTGLAPGNYDLILVDNRGCTFTTPRQTLTEPTDITFDVDVPKYANGYEVKCDGAKDGQIVISNTAGSYGAYKYKWKTVVGDSTDIVQGSPGQTALGAGIYELTIYSGLVGCPKTFRDTLNEPSKLVVTKNILNYNGYEVQCYGSRSGMVKLNVSGGGNGSYTYQWTTSDGSGLVPQSKDQETLSAGTYIVNIGYSSGLCTKTEQYTLHSPSRIQNDSIVSGIKCYGDTDASIKINISGGIPSYSYQWSSPDVTMAYPNAKDQTGLAPGTYRLVVTDGNGCVKPEVYSLQEPVPVSPNLVAEDMSCDPGDDGYITANPSGGTGNSYSFAWGNGKTTSTITGLTVGDYSVTVTDMNGCTGKESASISIPSPLTVTATAGSDFHNYNIDCYGNHTGKITLDIEYGRGGYQYVWLSGDVTGGLDHLAAGFYSVEVTDKFNCKGSASITLTQPDQLWGQPITTNITCPGGNNGSIQALVGGGIMSLPYSYQWSNGAADSPVASNLTADAYKVRITDSNNCYFDLQATLTQPPAFAINFTPTDAFCPETNDGDIRAVVSGGTPPYTYLWPGVSGATASNITDVLAGTYTLEVTDAVNCKYSQTIELGYTSEGCLRIPNAFSPNDDGSNDRWEITVGDPKSSVRYPLRDLYPNAIVQVYSANWGLLLYSSQKGYPEPWDGKYHGKYLPVNSYFYIIKLNNNSKPITGNVTIIR